MAAASSPPAARVMTTLEAMVVGRQDVVSMPMMTGTEGVPLSRAPAAREMWMMAVFCWDERVFYIGIEMLVDQHVPSITAGKSRKLMP